VVGEHVTWALGVARDVGIVRRDVQPQNLLIGTFGQIKVCDFGSTALTRDGAGRTDDTVRYRPICVGDHRRVAHDNHGSPGVSEGPQLLHHEAFVPRVESGCGLIEDQQIGPAQQFQGNVDTLAPPARQVCNLLFCMFVEVQLTEHDRNPGISFSLAGVGRETQPSCMAQRRAGSQQRVQDVFLRYEADAMPHLAKVAIQVQAVEPHRAGRCGASAGDCAEQG